MNQQEEIEYYKSIGFVFTQTEFCKRGNEVIILDVFPRIYEDGNGKSFTFSCVEDFKNKINSIL